MILIAPSIEYDEQIQAYRREFLEYGGSMDGRRKQSSNSKENHPNMDIIRILADELGCEPKHIENVITLR